MKIRVQPKELYIDPDPKGDPFKYDMLNRKEPIEILTTVIGNIDGPCILPVDAPWGTGKTTFIRLWRQYLINNGFTVISFNAWENDFFNDPFTALCAEFTADKDSIMGGEQLTKAGIKLMKHVAWNASSLALRASTAGLVNVSDLIKPDEAMDVSNKLKQYTDAKTAIEEFRAALESVAGSSSDRKGHPLVVMIDELDRCRPTYAVELLEVTKHVFSVNNIVIVLALNRAELAHSVTAVYGADLNAAGYLQRFFNVDFQLPEPDREAFIRSQLPSTQLKEYFDRTEDGNAKDIAGSAISFFYEFSTAFNLSLRQIEQSLRRLGLVVVTLESSRSSFFFGAMLALVLRTIDPPTYHKFISGKSSDLDVVDKFFDGADESKKALQDSKTGALFEAVLIMAYKEILQNAVTPYDSSSPATPLEQRHREKKYPHERWKNVLGKLEELQNDATRYPDNSLGFIASVKRIELLAPEMTYTEPD